MLRVFLGTFFVRPCSLLWGQRRESQWKCVYHDSLTSKSLLRHCCELFVCFRGGDSFPWNSHCFFTNHGWMSCAFRFYLTYRSKSSEQVHAAPVITSVGFHNISKERKNALAVPLRLWDERKWETQYSYIVFQVHRSPCVCFMLMKSLGFISVFGNSTHKHETIQALIIELLSILKPPYWLIKEPEQCPHSDSLLFIPPQQVLSVYSPPSWDPVNIVTLTLCSLWAAQQASAFIG